jgi:hypothetical protein
VAEHLARALVPEQCVAQWTGQAIEHRRAPQEGALVLFEGVQQLVAHVVGQQPVVTPEAGDGAMEILRPVQRQRREVQARGPALRAPEQHEHVPGLEVEPREAEHRRRFPPRHRQVALTDVDEASGGSQPTDPKQRLLPGGEHELRSGRHGVRDGAQRLHGTRAVQPMHVVEDEYERVLGTAQGGHELVDDRARSFGGRQAQRDGVVDRQRDRSAEAVRVVVAIVDRHPGDTARIVVEPVDE